MAIGSVAHQPECERGLIYEPNLAAILMGPKYLCNKVANADLITSCDNEVVGALVFGETDVTVATLKCLVSHTKSKTCASGSQLSTTCVVAHDVDPSVV